MTTRFPKFWFGAFVLSLPLWAMVQAQGPDIEWLKTTGGRFAQQGTSVALCSDGGYAVAGYGYVSATNIIDVYVVRTDALGGIVWEKTYGGHGDEWANAISLTADGGFILAGGREEVGEDSDILLLRLDASGNLVWQRVIGGYDQDEALSLAITSDGGFVLAGWTRSYGAGNDDFYVVKTDAQGYPQWQRTFGDIFYDKAFDVIEASDGTYMVAGGRGYWGSTPVEMYLVKLSASGDSLWARTYGGFAADAANGIVESVDGGFVLAGWTMSFGAGSHDFYLVKIDENGQQISSATFGGMLSDVARSIAVTDDGGYIVVGYTWSFSDDQQDMYVIRTDKLLNGIWTRVVGGPDFDNALDVAQAYDGGFAIAGWTRSFGATSLDILLFKFAAEHVAIDEVGEGIPETFHLEQNYPNPFNAATTITFTVPSSGDVRLAVYDLLGREVKALVNGTLAAGTYRVSFDATELPSGIYIYSLGATDFASSRQMILVK